jgi:hypothetical protein
MNTEGCQDTGNPVIDSTVNIFRAFVSGRSTVSLDQLRPLHAALLELAEKEPGGLFKRLGAGGAQTAASLARKPRG